MASARLLKLMNEGIAREIQVSFQYMWQHVRAQGISGAAVTNIFREIAGTEMKHAEAIAERLDYLGGVPTTQPTPITVGESLKEMITNDIKAEEEAIKLYKTTIKAAEDAGDVTTRLLFEDILAAEEDHHHKFTKLLKE